MKEILARLGSDPGRIIVLGIVFLWLLVMNLTALLKMGQDKLRAVENKRRISEKELFLFCLLGGSLGSCIGMFGFRHKTRHWYFLLGMPFICLVHTGLLVWLIIALF